MAVYEQILPTGGDLNNPLGFSFANTVYPKRQTDANSWSQNGIPACQAALNRGDRIGFLFFRRTGSPTWGNNNYDMDDPKKDYLCVAYAIPATTVQNWLPGIMIRDHHHRLWNMMHSDGNNRRVHRLWEATEGGAEFDVKGANANFEAIRKGKKFSVAVMEFARSRHSGGSEGTNQVDVNGWGWKGTFSTWVRGVMPQQTGWVSAWPSGT